jgi:hypothetical protein
MEKAQVGDLVSAADQAAPVQSGFSMNADDPEQPLDSH